MADSRQHVLVVGGREGGLDRVAPMLRRAEFSVHTVEASPFLLDLVLSTAFELVVVSYPLDDLSIQDLLNTIRNEGSACHGAGLLLLSDPSQLEAAQALVDNGANRAVCTDWNEARLWRAVGDLLSVAPRVFMRVLMHASIEIQSPRDRAVFQTVNVSMSGALLQGAKLLPPGNSFEFLFRLPGGGLVEGTAEVVRQANPMREGVEGIGARFVDFRDHSDELLIKHIERQIDLGNNR
jgi:hypothetical protein